MKLSFNRKCWTALVLTPFSCLVAKNRSIRFPVFSPYLQTVAFFSEIPRQVFNGKIASSSTWPTSFFELTLISGSLKSLTSLKTLKSLLCKDSISNVARTSNKNSRICCRKLHGWRIFSEKSVFLLKNRTMLVLIQYLLPELPAQFRSTWTVSSGADL